MVEIKDIVKTYGDHKAVDHLSFTMEKGKIYGFLGPNGAGKSTTMNIMTGYIAASSGTVSIEGLDIVKEPEEAKKHIGYLPEIPPLYQDMTVLEYLNFAAELKLVPKSERKDQINDILKLTGLEDYSSRLIRNLSKGYKQRVGLAQALTGYPDVIILDEPTVGLDPLQILEMREIIRSLKDDHIVMISSHILSEVNEVCDEVMIISHGKLVAQGAPEELEHMIGKTVTMNITVIGEREAVSEALSGLESVKSTDMGETADDGSIKVTVEIDAGDRPENEIRADIAKSLAAAGLPVMSMSTQEHSLEEVFLELTTSDNDAAETETAADSEAADPEEASDNDAENSEEASVNDAENSEEASFDNENDEIQTPADDNSGAVPDSAGADLPSDEESGEAES
ncbi:MAG: ATP-binding cassette domain-containing protein [Lachnospiraceae bacterium]|nr:ATP-binding cassette domain-containing protein [Lachnospiraceae bacterium]